jgi:hypothetical protein
LSVTSGIGTLGPPMRWGTDAEMILLKLTSWLKIILFFLFNISFSFNMSIVIPIMIYSELFFHSKKVNSFN